MRFLRKINKEKIKSFIKIHKKDIYICLILLVLAAIPRILFLANIPSGLHGDEAWTGLDARRILSTGIIEPYVGSALGQPTGPLYFTALIFKLFGDSIFWLRFSMAFFWNYNYSVILYFS